MSGLVEFIIKMQDGLSGPLNKIAGQSTQANTALGKLTESNKQLKGMVGQTGNSVNDLRKKVDRLKEMRDLLPSSAESQLTSVNQQISSLNKEIDNLQKKGTSGGLNQWLAELVGGIPAILKNPLTFIGAGLATAINSGMRNSREQLDFQLLLGDEVGKNLYDRLKKAAPVMGNAFLEGGKALLESGMSVGSIEPLLNRLGDISLGNKDKFGVLVQTFSKVKEEGKLTEDSLQALNSAGFKPLATLSKATGESLSSLEKRLIQGKISVQEVEQAFEAATGTGGEFAGKLAEIAASPTGKWDEISSKILGLADIFGDALMPVLTVAFDVLNTGLDWLAQGAEAVVGKLKDVASWAKQNSIWIKSLAGAVLGGVLAYKAYQAISMAVWLWQMKDLVATSLLTSAKGLLTIVTGNLAIAQGFLNAAFLASPIGWVVVSIGALVGGIMLAWNKFEGFRRVVFGLWEAFKQVFTNIGNLFKQIFQPIGDTITAIQEGRWKDVAKSSAKALYNITPVGFAHNVVDFTKAGGFSSVGDAYTAGLEKGSESWEKSQEKATEEDVFATEPGSLLEYMKKTDRTSMTAPSGSSMSGVNAVSGGGSKNVTLNINKMFDNTQISIQNSMQQLAREMQRIAEEAVVRGIASGSAK